MLTDFGGYEKIKVKNISKPEVKEDHIIVEVKACGMNFSDLYTRQGIYTFHGVRPPFVLGSEAAGIVSEIGSNVADIKVIKLLLIDVSKIIKLIVTVLLSM